MVRGIQPASFCMSLVTILIVSGSIGLCQARADQFQFVLQNGGRVEGDWLNIKSPPPKIYRVETVDGGQITLHRSQIKKLIRKRPEELEYRRISPTVADTVEAQWELAEWCRQRRLLDQRAAHLQRIIQLSPDHIKARHALGYTQLGDKWLTSEQWHKEQGHVFYRGRWRLEQEVDILEANSSRERAERQWMRKLKVMPNEAQKQIVSTRDPNAVRALQEKLAAKSGRKSKLTCIKLLGAIGNQDAMVTLINTSLNDPDVEVFHACIEEVVRLKSPFSQLAYIRGLKDANNVRVNRAANALGRIGGQEAIAPLIESLVTTHQKIVSPPSGGGNSGMPISSTFARPRDGAAAPATLGRGPTPNLIPAGRSGGTTFSPGGGKPQIISFQVPNDEVLTALAKLTGGVSFGFDQKAWKNWLALQHNRGETGPLRSAR